MHCYYPTQSIHWITGPVRSAPVRETMRSSSIQSSFIPRRPDQSEPRLATNHPFSKLVEVTKWGVDPILRAPHSLGAASVASTTTRTRSTPIKRDEPCFITKSSSYAHEKAHWVNAVRNNATLKREIVGGLKLFLSCISWQWYRRNPSYVFALFPVASV